MARSPTEPAPIAATTDQQRSWSQVTHLIGLISAMPGISVIGLIITAVLWRMRHEDSEFLDDHGREATNFQLSIFLYSVGAAVLAVAVPPIGALGVVVIGALTIVGCVLGARAAGRSEYFRYPASIRILSEPRGEAAAQ